MPKMAAYALVWLADQGIYARREPKSSTLIPLQQEEKAWFDWLAERSSFAFQGQEGHLTLRKEARLRHNGYWYA